MKKKALFILPLVALFGVLAFAFKPVSYSPAFAEGDETSEVAPNQENDNSQEEPNIVDEVIANGEATIEETKTAIEKFKDTFLIPLLSGVSVFSILSTVISISMAVLNKRSNGKVREKAVEIIAQATDIVAKAITMKETAEKQYEETKALALDVKEKAQALIDSGKLLEEDVKRLYGIKDTIVALLEVEAKKLANEGNAVASGLAEDVNKLVEETKLLVK